MLDIMAPEVVEIQTSRTGKILWVNVDGKCVLRICRIPDNMLHCRLLHISDLLEDIQKGSHE